MCCGAGGGLGSLTRGRVYGGLGCSGVLAGMGMVEAGGVAVDSLLALSRCILSPSR